MARKRNEELARAIGQRIDQAREAAGFDTIAAFSRAMGRGERLLRRYLDGEMMAGVEALMDVARTCEVSVDWLVFGHERTPPALAEWLDSPLGREAAAEHPRMLRLIRSLPLRGFQPKRGFYDHLYIGLRSGLLEEVGGVRELVSAARDAENLTR